MVVTSRKSNVTSEEPAMTALNEDAKPEEPDKRLVLIKIRSLGLMNVVQTFNWQCHLSRVEKYYSSGDHVDLFP